MQPHLTSNMVLLGALAFLASVFVPMARIFYRAGFSWAWALLVFIPYFGWAACWIILGSQEWRRRRAH